MSLDNILNFNPLETVEEAKGYPDTEPASYRKLKVTQIENSFAEECEKNRKAYREAVMSTRNTDAVFKHLKF